MQTQTANAQAAPAIALRPWITPTLMRLGGAARSAEKLPTPGGETTFTAGPS